MEILLFVMLFAFFVMGISLGTAESKNVPRIIPKYDIAIEAGEFPIRTDLIEPSTSILRKCGYKVKDIKTVVNAIIVENPTIDDVGDVVKMAVAQLKGK